jgi:hypothetical protein
MHARIFLIALCYAMAAAWPAQAGVTAVDLKTNTVTTGLVAGKITHGLVPHALDAMRKVVKRIPLDGCEEATGLLKAYDARAGRVVASIAVGRGADAPIPYPGVLPGTFEFLVDAPN